MDSPCISICQIGEDGYCLGCGRTRDEIRAWKQAPEDQKAEILDRSVKRRASQR